MVYRTTDPSVFPLTDYQIGRYDCTLVGIACGVVVDIVDDNDVGEWFYVFGLLNSGSSFYVSITHTRT